MDPGHHFILLYLLSKLSTLPIHLLKILKQGHLGVLTTQSTTPLVSSHPPTTTTLNGEDIPPPQQQNRHQNLKQLDNYSSGSTRPHGEVITYHSFLHYHHLLLISNSYILHHSLYSYITPQLPTQYYLYTSSITISKSQLYIVNFIYMKQTYQLVDQISEGPKSGEPTNNKKVETQRTHITAG